MTCTYNNFSGIEQREIDPCSILSMDRMKSSALEHFKERPHTSFSKTCENETAEKENTKDFIFQVTEIQTPALKFIKKK